MQGYEEFKIVFIPRLNNDTVCPVKAFQNMIRTMHLKPIDLLFLINIRGSNRIHTAFKVRSLIAQCVVRIVCAPKDFHFMHLDVVVHLWHLCPLDHIKLHGHWKSNPVWTYLQNALKAGGNSGS